jgi:hypothetical protein
MLNNLNNNIMYIDYDFLVNYCVFDFYKMLVGLALVLSLSAVILLPTIFMAGRASGQN